MTAWAHFSSPFLELRFQSKQVSLFCHHTSNELLHEVHWHQAPDKVTLCHLVATQTCFINHGRKCHALTNYIQSKRYWMAWLYHIRLCMNAELSPQTFWEMGGLSSLRSCISSSKEESISNCNKWLKTGCGTSCNSSPPWFYVKADHETVKDGLSFLCARKSELACYRHNCKWRHFWKILQSNNKAFAKTNENL